MNDLVGLLDLPVARAQSVENFAVVQNQQDAFIALAAAVKRWDLLEAAVDAKIADQAAFVSWWDENVQRPGGDQRSEIIVSRPDTMVLSVADTGVKKMQVSRWRKSLRERDAYRARIILSAYRKADLSPAGNHRAEGSGENEWFTPEKYIEAARRVMGDIDLDPASNPIAQETVRAEQYFTRDDDGLAHDWCGRIWLNPPYAQPLIGQFVHKLIGELAAGRATQAILLTHNYTDTAWFHEAQSIASYICFTKGRIRFLDADGGTCAPTQGQAFFYYGDEFEAFREVFLEFGFVLR